jgi:hypothetical protein
VMSCLTAASGGLLLGYDISVTGQSTGVDAEARSMLRSSF